MRFGLALLLIVASLSAWAGAGKLTNSVKTKVTVTPPETPEQVAGRCAPVNLRSTLGPVRNQDDLYWCYAFTAADMVSQALRQEKSGLVGLTADGVLRDDVSALHVTGSHQLRKRQNLLDHQKQGGNIAEAARSAIARGRLCRESELSSQGGTRNPELVRLQEASQRSRSAENRSQMNQRLSEELIQSRCRAAEMDMQVLSFGSDTRASEYARNDSVSENRKLRQEMDKALDQGRMAGIGFRSAFMMDRPGHRYHAVGIIGRKMINGKCNYLVRDSYGPGCRSDYHPEYRKRCQNGETWVEEDALVKNIATVNYIPASEKTANDWREKVDKAGLTPTEGVQ